MRINLQDIHINQRDLDLFLTLNDRSKLEFLSDLQYKSKDVTILNQVNKFKNTFQVEDEVVFDRKIFKHKSHTVLVILRENVLIISSNNKKAIKEVKWKFFSDGYMFKSQPIIKHLIYYRYTEFYKTLGITTPICLS